MTHLFILDIACIILGSIGIYITHLGQKYSLLYKLYWVCLISCISGFIFFGYDLFKYWNRPIPQEGPIVTMILSQTNCFGRSGNS
jgi:hypothetical protein